MKMKILVLGSSGFIGSQVLKNIDSRLFEARAINMRSSNFFQEIENSNFDIVVNCIGSANVQSSFDSPLTDFSINTKAFLEILESVRRRSKKAKVIHISSAAVYGNPETLPIDENHPRNPISPYGIHKAISEDLAQSYFKMYQIPICVLRPFSIYGPGQKKLLFWDLYKKIRHRSSDEIQLFGTGHESRDYIYISDFVAALESVILHAPFKAEFYNAACGQEIEIQKVSQIFCSYIAPEVHFKFTGNLKKGDPNQWQANIGALTKLGFKPKVEIHQGLEKTALWCLQEKI